jgi:hypothetical protein
VLIFVLLALQAWQGTPVTQPVLAGTISAATALNGALWVVRAPLGGGRAAVLAAFAAAWLGINAAVYVLGPPTWLLAALILGNGAALLAWYRQRPHAAATVPRGRLTDAALPTIAFLFLFFVTTRLVPDFVRGILVSFPIILLPTLDFVHRTFAGALFIDFVARTQIAVLSNSVFIVSVYTALAYMPATVVLIPGLLLSVAATMAIQRCWEYQERARMTPSRRIALPGDSGDHRSASGGDFG